MTMSGVDVGDKIHVAHNLPDEAFTESGVNQAVVDETRALLASKRKANAIIDNTPRNHTKYGFDYSRHDYGSINK